MSDIQEKARELFAWSAEPRTITECEDFIRSIKKPSVSKEFVEKYYEQIRKDIGRSMFTLPIHTLVEFLKEAGVEVE